MSTYRAYNTKLISKIIFSWNVFERVSGGDRILSHKYAGSNANKPETFVVLFP